MATPEDTVFEPLEAHSEAVLASLLARTPKGRSPQSVESVTAPVAATLAEFDREDRPVVLSNNLVPGERLVARSTVSLERRHLGCTVLVLCENGDARLPIVVGVIQAQATPPAPALASDRKVVIQADDDCYVVDAEREIVLRCGESSITLTRAGKVIIQGKYILSRSSGYNKIKGAVVDIN